MFLLDGLHEDLNRVLKKPTVEPFDAYGSNDEHAAQEAWFRHTQRNQSVVVDLFQGQLKSSITCTNSKCNFVSAHFYLLQLHALQCCYCSIS